MRVPHEPKLSKPSLQRPILAGAIAGLCVLSSVGSALPTAAQSFQDSARSAFPETAQGVRVGRTIPHVVYTQELPNGERARVFSGGFAEVFGKDNKEIGFRRIPRALGAADGLPDRATVMADLMMEKTRPFAEHRVIVVFRDGAAPTRDLVTVDADALAAMRGAGNAQSAPMPEYTSDIEVNRAFARIGVDRSERLFSSLDRSTLSSMYMRAGGVASQQMINPANAYALHVVNSSVGNAVAQLSKMPSIVYASPDWTVSPMVSPGVRVSSTDMASARAKALAIRPGMLSASNGVPTNFALSSSAQSMLNAPSDGIAAAYEEIQRAFHQLPGAGEIITNVSIGDVDDESIASKPSTYPCQGFVTNYGPTTVLLGGQHYIDWPSMPLIAAYTANNKSKVSGSNIVCGQDPSLTEVGLDFSMMAPLPHDRQRPAQQGLGFTDLLGIAPGAQYRLVVPDTSGNPALSDIDAALLAAALQTPRPNVISASLGFGFDSLGFPTRYLEDDRLTEAVISSIVHSYGIVVAISAGDGLRASSTNAAWGPSGGSAETDVIKPGETRTLLDDVYLSTSPSIDLDSGSIDAGATTLDDIFGAPPHDPAFAALAHVHAFPETRWTGFETFSSGYGPRVNLSAPGDNVIAFSHAFPANPPCNPCGASSVNVTLEGGTSASAPQIAAVAAVAMQVARLTGHPFTSPAEVRTFLASTANPVTPASQEDQPLNVGPQVNLTNAVETLIAKTGSHVALGFARTAIEQRRDVDDPFATGGGVFESDTDPSDIDLMGPTIQYVPTGGFSHDWITIAPDWEGTTPTTTYRLFAANRMRNPIVTTRWARVLPEQLFRAAGIAYPNPSSKTIKLKYIATNGAKSVVDDISLTFSTAPATSRFALAPIVPSVVTGATIPVKYDISHLSTCIGEGGCAIARGALLISYPGRPSTPGLSATWSNNVLTVPLQGLSGTANIPVSALPGGGIYAIQAALYHSGAGAGKSDFSETSYIAYTRVAPAGIARPSAPLLSSDGSKPGHNLDIPYAAPFQVAYDVSSVPGATGAEVEVSAPGPGFYSLYSMFNNPNGTQVDHDGTDTGSVFARVVSGTRGTMTINPVAAGMMATLNENVRVIPLKGSVAAGEASDVSSVEMDGITPTDGGSLAGGFGIDGSGGNDGFLTSQVQRADGTPGGSIETFDQSTYHISHDVPALRGRVPYTLGWGIWGGNVGMLGQVKPAPPFPVAFGVMNSVPGGKVGAAWTPPANLYLPRLEAAAANQVNDDGVFYWEAESGRDLFYVFTSNLLTNTSGPLIDISKPALLGMPNPVLAGFGENTKTKTAVAAFSDWTDTEPHPPLLVTADLSTGAVDSIGGVVGENNTFSLAVDSTTNKAAVGTWTDHLIIYDLANKTARVVNLPTYWGGLYTAVDTVHHLFLVEALGGLDTDANNNAGAIVAAFDENGNLVKVLEKFAVRTIINSSNLQVDPIHRMLYLYGPGDEQLESSRY